MAIHSETDPGQPEHPNSSGKGFISVLHDQIQTRKESKQESKQPHPCKSPEGRGVISKMMQEALWSRVWEENTWDLKIHVFYVDGAMGEEAYESTMRREG